MKLTENISKKFFQKLFNSRRNIYPYWKSCCFVCQRTYFIFYSVNILPINAFISCSRLVLHNKLPVARPSPTNFKHPLFIFVHCQALSNNFVNDHMNISYRLGFCRAPNLHFITQEPLTEEVTQFFFRNILNYSYIVLVKHLIKVCWISGIFCTLVCY